MHVGIIGAGNMGSAFAKRLSPIGHSIAITATDMAHADKVASEIGNNARAVPPNAVARGVDLLILATPYAASAEALRTADVSTGTVVVDISNPVKPDMSGLLVGFTTSAAEEIQRAVPEARVVKAFNTVFAQILAGKAGAQVFCAGDDDTAKRTVRSLIESAGFDPMDAGPLANARYLEPLGMLNIYLGYRAGLGTAVAPAELKVA
jgi:8-hydroxy-5-deazaflavin:NADPH oxidoreductase